MEQISLNLFMAFLSVVLCLPMIEKSEGKNSNGQHMIRSDKFFEKKNLCTAKYARQDNLKDNKTNLQVIKMKGILAGKKSIA